MKLKVIAFKVPIVQIEWRRVLVGLIFGGSLSKKTKTPTMTKLRPYSRLNRWVTKELNQYSFLWNALYVLSFDVIWAAQGLIGMRSKLDTWRFQKSFLQIQISWLIFALIIDLKILCNNDHKNLFLQIQKKRGNECLVKAAQLIDEGTNPQLGKAGWNKYDEMTFNGTRCISIESPNVSEDLKAVLNQNSIRFTSRVIGLCFKR